MIVSGRFSLKRESWSSDIGESLIHAFRRNAADVSTEDDQALVVVPADQIDAGAGMVAAVAQARRAPPDHESGGERDEDDRIGHELATRHQPATALNAMTLRSPSQSSPTSVPTFAD